MCGAMGWSIKQILSDPSLPAPYSIRRFVCPVCFFSFESVYYSASAMDVVDCPGCVEVFYFSHRSLRLFNWAKSESFPESCFVDIKHEFILPDAL